jgi:hypothetical protein
MVLNRVPYFILQVVTKLKKKNLKKTKKREYKISRASKKKDLRQRINSLLLPNFIIKLLNKLHNKCFFIKNRIHV